MPARSTQHQQFNTVTAWPFDLGVDDEVPGSESSKDFGLNEDGETDSDDGDIIGLPHILGVQSTRADYEEFMQQLNAKRGTNISDLRKKILPLIFIDIPNITGKLSAEYDRTTVPEFQKLLKFDPAADKYSKYAPFLYPGGKKNGAKLFMVKEVALALKGKLFGPAALKCDQNYAHPKTNAQLWSLNTVTPGAIAGILTEIFFILSPDNVFAIPGAKSGIDYAKIFSYYKEIMVTKSDTVWCKSLIKFYNGIVFSAHGVGTIGQPSQGSDEDGSSGIDDELMNQLDGLTFDQSEDEHFSIMPSSAESPPAQEHLEISAS
ncbi:hypothetical protein BDQ12DRAFT_665469 [Crucibulum laeve]|uniref:Uncharacterized protein n=1 Tax=Crucibulum laeve TaxID=68775 RepID=A0A5C3M1M3_9AGAR|nr:hypothetical protein BDQ12DRAFT_665469 [Crucibulum laeve]